MVIMHSGCHEITPNGASRRAFVEGAVVVGLVFTAPTGRHELGDVDGVVRDEFPGAKLAVAVNAGIVRMSSVLDVVKAKGSC